MKTSKLKMLLAKGIITACLIAGSSIFAFGGNPSYTNSSSSKYQKENSDVKNDISNINLLKENIQTLQEKEKADMKAGLKTEVVMDKRDLMKRKADLEQQYTYLKADKMDLVKDHKMAICSAKAEVKKDQSKLSAAQKQLNKDIAAGNESAIESDAKLVAQQQRVLNRDEAALDSEQKGLNSDLVAVKNQLNPKTGHTNKASSYAQVDNE